MAKRKTSTKEPKSPTWAKGLHARHRRFLELYVTNGFNATAAYIGAGYKEAGAAQNASALIRTHKVAAALKLLLDECLMSDAELLARISDEATASMMPFLSQREIGEHGSVGLDLDAAAQAGKLHHVKKFKVKRTKYGEEISIELVDRQRAQEMLLKVKGLSVDRMEVSGPGGAPVPVAQTVDLRLKLKGVSDSALEELERVLEEGDDDDG